MSRTIDISSFYVAGINYRKSDAQTRGDFAVDDQQYLGILESAPSFAVKEFFVLSTCNRTEIYGFAENEPELIRLLCAKTRGELETFGKIAYVKKGIDAVGHLFQVAAGLDSQILGDYEIVSQLKRAVKCSREHGFVGAFTERLVNAVLQSSKIIKNQTSLSGGTVSVSFAAVRCIRERVAEIAQKKILLVGTGKIGRSTCKNLVDYLDTKNIRLINRSGEKSETVGAEMGLSSAPYECLAEEVGQADIIIVATNSATPILGIEELANRGEKLIIDLSIPNNVDTRVSGLEGISLLNVDDLSKINDATLEMRKAEIPRAKDLIAVHIVDFLEWYEMRKNVPLLKAVKTKLKEIHHSELYAGLGMSGPSAGSEEKIQLVINGMATKMRAQNRQGCHYIEAINDFISEGKN